MDKLIVVDGHNLLFRMFFGMPRPFYDKHGNDIKAVVGFIGSIAKLLKKLDSERIVILFDTETSIKNRSADFGDYKQNRIDYSQVADEENPFTQLPLIYKTLEHMGVCYLEAKDHEADDYIASICTRYQSDYEIFIVSTDSDFNQLVNDQVKIFNPRGRDGMIFDQKKVYEKFGVEPSQIIEYKALVGDNSDNIPGVKGIGPKRAVEILSFGTIETLLTGNSELAEKYLVKLEEFEELIKRNIRLIKMTTDIDVSIEDEVMKIHYDINKSPIRLIEEVN